jgi:pre-mRNA-splicing factor CWC22
VKRDEPDRGNDENSNHEGQDDAELANYLKAKRAKVEDNLTTRTGGAYIPPARLRMMQEQISDKASLQYQRLSWEALKKSINGLINKANVSNIVHIVRELFQENIVRGRGLLVRSLMQAQAASPTFTHVYAALVAIINTKFPQIGELIVKRLIIQFRKGYRRNDKNVCLSASRFIAHLVNQKVAHEVLSLEVLHVLLENPSNDSVELAVGFLKECGQRLTEVSPKGVTAVFERLRVILHEAQIDKRVQYMIEVMFAIRKDGFKDHPSVVEELDIVEEDDQVTHMLALENGDNPEDGLNVFKLDPNFLENEEKYKELKREILGESSSEGEEGGESGSDDEEGDDDESDEEGEKKPTVIVDNTETNLIALRRTIYLTIQSSLDFEECSHKLIKMQLKPGQEDELCSMILDCCAQQRTFEKFFGLLAQRFCMIDRKYIAPFQRMFTEQYNFIHRLETNKLRNIAKLFAHLLHTDAISWEVLECVHLNEDETTSSSRIFIKILFQELCEFMGLTKLNNRLKDATLQPFFEGLFPRDNPRNTRFSINFFTSIGLGGLTDELRAHLKSMPKQEPKLTQQSSSSESSSSSSSDTSSDDSDDSSDSDSSDEDIAQPPKLSQYLNAPPKSKGGPELSAKTAREPGDDSAKSGNHHSKHDQPKNRDTSEHNHRKVRHDRGQPVVSAGVDSDDDDPRKSRHGSDRHRGRYEPSKVASAPKPPVAGQGRDRELERAQRRLLELANYNMQDAAEMTEERGASKKHQHDSKKSDKHSRSPGHRRH